MPRAAVSSNNRLALRIDGPDKALLLRAVEIENTDLTSFVVRTAVSAAREVVERAERVELSARDSAYVLELLEKPPLPNERLIAAARSLRRGQ